MKPREIKLSSGTEILLGKNAENNDELMKEFKGKENIILHTSQPGSPFCVILSSSGKPSQKEIKEASIYCAKYSQDWRDNKSNVNVDVFTGKDVSKPFFLKKGTWRVKNKHKTIKVKKSDIEKCQ